MDITKHFSFEGKALTTQTDENGLDWFSANDVAAALGYANPSKSVRDHVDDDDLTKRRVIDNMGRNQVANFVNESGLYSLILRSNKPEAKRFKRWVTNEVLPSIRKDGGYISSSATTEQMTALKQRLQASIDENRALTHALDHQKLRNDALDLEVRQKCAENVKLTLYLEELPSRPLHKDCDNYLNECIYSDGFVKALRSVKTNEAYKYFIKVGRKLDRLHADHGKLKEKYNELVHLYRKITAGNWDEL